MFKSKCIQCRYLIAFFLFLIAFYGYNIQRIYGFYIFPDEFGYWSYAARAVGYDWSDIVSLGSYYSYGYSLILFPILKICKDGVTAYRAAVTVNFVLLGVDALILNKLLGKMIQKDSNLSEVIPRESIPLLAGIAVLYPPNLFYAKTTMVEVFLMSMFLLIMYLLYIYLENNRLSVMMCLLTATVYIHFLHMRAVGASIAVVATIAIYFIRNSKKARQLFLATFLCLMLTILGFAAKGWLQDAMYTGAEASKLNINDYAGQMEKFAYILTKEGMQDFMCGLSGKVLYLGLSSFGLVYFGIGRCAREIKKYFLKQNSDNTALIYLFLVLALIGEILISTIYHIHPNRVDNVTYGRYDEFVLPALLMLGAIEIFNDRRVMTKVMCIIPIQAVMTYLSIFEIEKYQLTDIHGYFMVGMSYLHYLMEYTTKNFYWGAFLFGTVLMIVIIGVLKFAHRNKMTFVLIGIILIEFLLFLRASSIYQNVSSLGAYRDSVMANKIEELLDREADRRVVYLKEDDNKVISSIQFLLMDKKVEIIDAKENVSEYTGDEIDDNDIVVISHTSNYGEKLETLYHNNMLVGRFWIYYN